MTSIREQSNAHDVVGRDQCFDVRKIWRRLYRIKLIGLCHKIPMNKRCALVFGKWTNVYEATLWCPEEQIDVGWKSGEITDRNLSSWMSDDLRTNKWTVNPPHFYLMTNTNMPECSESFGCPKKSLKFEKRFEIKQPLSFSICSCLLLALGFLTSWSSSVLM